MSLDLESSPSSSRDWFFRSHSLAHHYTPENPKYRRSFSSNPRLSQPLPPDSKSPITPTFLSVSSSNSSSFREYNYPVLRRTYSSSRIGAENDAVLKKEKEKKILEKGQSWRRRRKSS